MSEPFIFHPDRRLGTAFQSALAAFFLFLSGWGLWQATQATIGPTFLLYLVPVFLSIVLLPLLGYRLYALHRAGYSLERDGIRLRWGLRAEDIPMDQVLWVRQAQELELRVRPPWGGWPGAVLGIRHFAGLGEVEFMASRIERLVLIATPRRAYAISPANPDEFLQRYHRVTELGSLSPIRAYAVYPTRLLNLVWADRLARALLLTGVLLSLGLLIWISLEVPNRAQIFLGFGPLGEPRDLVPAVRLMLLPVLNSMFFLIDLFLGLFFFRRGEGISDDRPTGIPYGQILAYLLWGGGALVPLMFLVSVFFILRT